MNRTAVLQGVGSVIRSRLSDLGKAGLELRVRGVFSDPDGTDELRIHAYRSDNLVDSLEIFLNEGGSDHLSQDEVEQWLSSEIDRLLTDSLSGGGWEAV
jgi:hypothetical protein